MQNQIKWSDHNLHDPGITLLEHLAYAISDLSYRLGFDMADLLAESGASQETKAFFSAAQILPQTPLSLLDYRKLLLDQEGVKNAWVSVLNAGEPALNFDNGIISLASSGARLPKYLRGIYKVEIEPDDLNNPPAPQAIRSTLARHRNLCEDVQQITIFGENDIEPVTLQLDLEVTDNRVDLTQLWDLIAADLTQWIAPNIRFYSLPEMLQRGKSIDEIFTGPLLEHGFLDEEEVKNYAKKTALRASDILHRVMDLGGVKLVRQVLMSTPARPGQKQYLSLSENQIPRLERLEINVYAGGRRLFHKEATLSGSAKNTYSVKQDVPVPTGRWRNPARFISIANELPANYGIGPAGLPADATPRRKAQAQQLKAYLALFEQLLANQFAQLAHMRNLLSPAYDAPPTYVLNPLDTADGLPGIETLYKPDFADNLLPVLDPEARALERHHRRLDHLLARFGEDFPYPPASDVVDPAVMQQRKQQFLQDYADLGKGRGKAVDYRNTPLHNTGPLSSGLETRLRRLLGIRAFDETEFPLLDIDFYQEADQDGISEYRFRVKDRAENKIVLSSSKHYHDLLEARLELRWALQRAAIQSGYQLRDTEEETKREYFNIVDPSGEVIARRIEYFPKRGGKKRRPDAINRLKTLCAPILKQECLYIVEHSLIAPRQSDNDAMFEPRWRVIDPPVKNEFYDPWSMQISAVLPDFAGRFAGGKNSEFGLFVRELVESETPAHLTPRCCWLSEDAFFQFEACYGALLKKLCLGQDTTAETRMLNRLLGISERTRGEFQSTSLRISFNPLSSRKQYFSLPAAAIPVSTSEGSSLTISFWMRLEERVNGNGNLFSVKSGPTGKPLINIAFTSTQVVFSCGILDQSGRQPSVTLSLSSLGRNYVGRWIHWSFINRYESFTYSSQLHILVDGASLATATKGGELPEIWPRETLVRFGNFGTRKDVFKLNVTDLRIWNYARSEKDMEFDMDARLVGDETGLYGYWKLDKDSQGNDSTARQNHAVIYNCEWE
ncbi:MAG: hypothetical protein JNL02_09630 [Saprospiraceae bacterium]|nr:hypothetical protein [Saprospiraceae bacterium]